MTDEWSLTMGDLLSEECENFTRGSCAEEFSDKVPNSGDGTWKQYCSPCRLRYVMQNRRNDMTNQWDGPRVNLTRETANEHYTPANNSQGESMKHRFKSDIVLGEKYVDTQTGYEGVAIVAAFFQHGCERITLESYDAERKEIKEMSFDAPRLKSVRTGKVAETERTGGPDKAPAGLMRGSGSIR